MSEAPRVNVFQDLGRWLWHLLPANPILVRVVSMGGKRQRHFLARLIYLAALALTLAFISMTETNAESLADNAKASTRAFMKVSILQLFLMCFIAPVFCAGAITQEKDSNTFHILLTTPLTNGQIVLGSLFSRLYFVWVLLLAGLPIFCFTMIYGGVTTAEIFQSFGLAACTALVTGALAITIGFLRVGTRRTIFAFFVGIAVYLLGVGAIGLMSPGTWIVEAPLGVAPVLGEPRRMSWLAATHPFLALFVVTGQTPAPAESDVYAYGWPWRWALAHPQYAYMVWTTLASFLMVTAAVVALRSGAREGEASLLRRLRGVFARGETATGRKPRRVWSNPIAWREAVTRASAGGRSIIRWLFVIAGVATALLLLAAHFKGWWGLGTVATMRSALVIVVSIEFAVILLVTTNTAATALTREKESQTMELLLCTPLTSLDIIKGMSKGLERFVLPLIAVPIFTLALFVSSDLIAQSAQPIAAYEALVFVPLLIAAYVRVAATIGLNFSLKSRKTVHSVMSATAVVMGFALITFGCVSGVLRGAGEATAYAIFSPFAPFPAFAALINPVGTYDPFGVRPATEIVSARVAAGVASTFAAAMYFTLAYLLWKGMQRSFDMTMRRQAV